MDKDKASARSNPTEDPDREQDPIIRELHRVESSLKRSIGKISERVELLEGTTSLPPAKKRATESCALHTSWAEDPGPDSPPDLPEWADLEDGEDDITDAVQPVGVVSLPEENAALVASAFTAVLSNEERKRVRSASPFPDLVQTRCPRLDPLFSSSKIPKETKALDKELAKVQALVHDPIAPLAKFLKNFHSITPEMAYEVLKDTIVLLGNASGHISQLRRRKVLKAINPELVDLAGENHFSSSAPNLFGPGFEKVMKERAESVKLLEAAKPGPSSSKRFFRGGRSTVPPRGGGQFSRGRQWPRRDKPPMAKK